MPHTGHIFVEGALEAAFREVGEWVMHIGSAVLVAVISGLRSLWPNRLLPPPPDPGLPGIHIQSRYAGDVLTITAIVVTLALLFAMGWLLFVRMHRPGTPQEARRFRLWWWLFAALLLACTIGFDAWAIAIGPSFHQIKALYQLYAKSQADGSELLLLVLLLELSAVLVWYVISVLRSPPTVIAAVPFGAYVARLRWR